jgi:hypothetical protein
MQHSRIRFFVGCGVGSLLASCGAALLPFVFLFRVDTISDLWFMRLCNTLMGILFAAAFAFARLGSGPLSLFQTKVRVAIMTLCVFAITFGCLEWWGEAIVRVRWTIGPNMITRNRIAITRAGLLNYAHDCGSFPSQEQGLGVLLANPGIAGWKGPYVSSDELIDNWGYQLKFRVIGDRVDVWSVGPDAIDGTDDDIR